jgi:hypothetical protein
MELRDLGPARARAKRQLLLACALAAVTCFAILLRIAWVRGGTLYGSTPVSQADLIVNALTVATALQAVRAWQAHAAARTSQSNVTGPPPATTWSDLVTQVTGLIGLLGVVIALTSAFVTLSAPVTPPDVHGESCAGARVWDTPYVATNAVSTGVNTRRGPSRSFVVNGRFPGDCAVGFSGYCLGDPIPGSFGGTPHERWLGTRWLELAKHNGGLGGWLTRVVSKERPERQFMAESLINPQRPYNNIQLANDCPGTYPAPGSAKLAPADLSDADKGLAILSARAPHARNMGFAVWQPPGQPFVDPDAYVQVYNPEATPAQNPGYTGEDGEKKVVWRFRDQQIANLQKPFGPAAPPVNGRVVVLAIPCLSENVPAGPETAAMATYAVSSDGTLKPVSDPRLLASQTLDKERLSRAACEVPA